LAHLVKYKPQQCIKFMLTFKLKLKQLTFNKRFATTEKSPIFQSHKSYKNPL